jgi:uncharacterized protein
LRVERLFLRANPVKLRLEDITAEAKEIAFVEPEIEINRVLAQGPVRDYRVDGPIAVTLSYYRAGTDVFLEGRLQANTVATCARCAEDFSGANHREFRLVMAAKSVGIETDPGLRADDLEFSMYEGDEIDLAPLVREQLLLALPTRPLCHDDCRGLCPQCGIDLNRGECRCETARPDPRLAVLRSLKIVRN